MKRLVFLALAGCRGVLGIDDLPARPEADAAPDAADAGPRFCDKVTPKPEFCADFDDDGPLEEAFDNAKVSPDPGVGGGGKIDPDLEQFSSAPRSARLWSSAVLVARNATAYLAKMYDAPRANIDVVVDAKIATLDIPVTNGGHVIVLYLDFGAPGAIAVYRDAVGPAVAVFEGASPPTVTNITAPFPVGTWKSIHAFYLANATDGGANGEFHVLIDNTTGAIVPVPAALRAAKPSILVGPTITGPMGKFEMNVDNVRIDTR